MPVVNELIRSEADGAILVLVIISWIPSQSYQISNIVEIHTKLRHLTKSQSLRRTALCI